MVDLAQPISEWKDIESNKEDDQYLGDICFSLRYVPTSGKVLRPLRVLHPNQYRMILREINSH